MTSSNIYKIFNYSINQKYAIMTNIFLFLFYFSISRLTPYQGDDFIFKINPTSYSIDFNIIIEVMNSLWYWYNFWLGRLVGNFLLLHFLLPSKIFFDLINSIFQVLIINIIFYLAKNKIAKDKLDSTFLLLINLLLFFGFYGYAIVFHITTSIHYSWTHMFSFLYYIFFLKYWYSEYSRKRNLIFFIIGIIVGCGFEHVFISQLFCFLLLAILKISKRVSFLPYYTSYSFAGIIIGGAILMFAPGNFVRLRYSGLELSFNLSHIINYWSFEINWILSYIKYLWIIFFLVSLFYFFVLKRKFVFNNNSFSILSIGFISILSLSLSPVYHNCTNLFFYYCLLIFLLSLFNTDMISNKILNFAFIIIFLISIIFQGYMLVNQKKIYDYSISLEQTILEKRNSGEQDIEVKQIDIKTNRFINYQALFNKADVQRNQGIAKYYDINSIRTIN